MSKNCHNCCLLHRKGVSKYGFLYRCNGTIALTTRELQKGREEFCKMTDFMVRI